MDNMQIEKQLDFFMFVFCATAPGYWNTTKESDFFLNGEFHRQMYQQINS